MKADSTPTDFPTTHQTQQQSTMKQSSTEQQSTTEQSLKEQQPINVTSPTKFVEHILTKGGDDYFKLIEQGTQEQLLELYETLNNKSMGHQLTDFVDQHPNRNKMITIKDEIAKKLNTRLNRSRSQNKTPTEQFREQSKKDDNKALTEQEMKKIQDLQERLQNVVDFIHTDTTYPFKWFKMKGIFPELVLYATEKGFDKLTQGDFKTEWINRRFHDILIETPEQKIIASLDQETDPKVLDRLIAWVGNKLKEETWIPFTRLDLWRDWPTRLNEQQRRYLQYFRDTILPRKRNELLEKQEQMPQRYKQLQSPWFVR